MLVLLILGLVKLGFCKLYFDTQNDHNLFSAFVFEALGNLYLTYQFQ